MQIENIQPGPELADPDAEHPTSTPRADPADPPTGDPGELLDQMYQESMELLDDPRFLLAGALVRLRQADGIMAKAEASDDPYGPGPEELAHHYVATAEALTFIAEVAGKILPPGTGVTPDADGDLFAPAPQTYRPQPVIGVRYRLELHGDHLGMVGGAEWLYVAGYGYLDISGFERAARDPGGLVSYLSSGRVVSGTPEQVLVIDDGGFGRVLPRAMITEMPDDAR